MSIYLSPSAVLLAQRALEYLAGRRPRQLVDELHDSRQLVGGQMGTQEGDELRCLRGGAGPQDDQRLDRLTPAGGGHADDRGLVDRGMPRERLLDLYPVHVLAAADDHVLDAVGQEQVAIAVGISAVTRAQPSFGAQCSRRLIGPV